MAPEHSQWFDIAQKVKAVLTLPGAKERFRERVIEAAAEWQRRSDEKRKREGARTEVVKRTGVPRGSGPLSSDPKNGSFRWGVRIPGEQSPREAWLPADLSPDLDPDDSPPLPVPENREVSLAERYAVLAVIWNVYWPGDAKIDPYPDRGTWVGDRFELEGLGYHLLVKRVQDAKDNAPNSPFSDQDLAIMETWIDDVKADLPGGKPAAVDRDGRGNDPSKSGGAKLSPRELASKHGIALRALQGRLERWRREHDAGYVEVSNARKNEPKYLYDESTVKPVIDALKAKSVAQKRATNVQRKKV